MEELPQIIRNIKRKVSCTIVLDTGYVINHTMIVEGPDHSSFFNDKNLSLYLEENYYTLRTNPSQIRELMDIKILY